MLEVRDVRYAYRSKYQTNEVLRGVSCGFERGRFYAVVGPSGSGKTTLLSLLAGLDLPTAGEILVEGRSMATLDRDAYRRNTASVIYQSFNLLPLLTALENVALPLRMLGKSRKEADGIARACIARVNLPDRIARSLPSMMSGGEQQRIAIARAIAMGGKILLADEPTGNLDSDNGELIVELLRGLAREQGYLVVAITHSERVSERADAIYRISDGQLSGA